MAADLRKSLVLLSGGLDSAANLAFAHERGGAPEIAVTFDYGQRAAGREVASARALCDFYGVRHLVLETPWLGRLGGSALTDSAMAVPKLRPELLDDRATTEKSAKQVWVPNRNGVMINIAAAVAEAHGLAQVLVGFNIEEAATFPDNTAEYMKRATAALGLSTSNHVEVFSYTVDWDKRRIVRELRGLKTRFPFDRLWSCYFDSPAPCGECESCRRLKRALGESEWA